MARAERRLRITVLTLVLAALLPASARGDAVPPPPTDCPPGSEGGTGHCGTYCMPKPCSDRTACATGSVCRETKLCIEQKTCSGGRPTPYDFQYPPFVRDEVKSSCATAACKTGTCRSITACLPPSATGDGAPPSRGCSCGLADPSRGVGELLSLLLALGLVAGLRRKRGAGR